MEDRAPDNRDNFLSWMYSPRPVPLEARENWPLNRLIDAIESDQPQTNGHKWAVRYIVGNSVEMIAKDEKLGENTGRIYMAIGRVASGLLKPTE